ncbi:NADH-quinone oxidoreductase subunit C [Brevibacillus laterosporus]|uniref:NADH-quinone oxidoreductase subunit C n=1 Tax=Brevibacillus laterosporus TaxID=1465 RepID=UPI0018CC861A|nr:NADH-quinone oxidoreductase subunit C [Brevibacillus laterosporus]MBG9800559.1 NADH-quinone oxidoreductase subunit C [Brevibacillus laterosporus]MCR8938851.1 NADH-quinone oxidoreductase subunit C [Brevibacillus laterosporus]MCZ0841491.1 NADH-quinone oxidoreductase subunit C [Brevibacillus laterosporus]MCZ0843851.1 NADH-quinone oxidoreductase subunit C [Brevibacillus laterosporus]MED1911577.1 NADH-quinone oxidoreductase subunit C [Brevibacillus laterosporus]
MSEEKRKPTPEEKAAAVAEAKAKAAAAVKAKLAQQAQANVADEEPNQSTTKGMAQGDSSASSSVPDEKSIAKAKAAAAAKAKAAAAAKAKLEKSTATEVSAELVVQEKETKASEEVTTGLTTDTDAKAKAAEKAKAVAAAKAKAAAAAAAKAKANEETVAAEVPPSKNQPYLDRFVQIIAERFGKESIEESYINTLSKEVPTMTIKNQIWHDIALFLKQELSLQFDYLSNLHGVDYEDRMEVYYHLYSYAHHQSLAIKVKTTREASSVASVVDVWPGADWNERETYDLLGIHFVGHPNLVRIMMPDEWVGHPLRKDYEPFDEGV